MLLEPQCTNSVTSSRCPLCPKIVLCSFLAKTLHFAGSSTQVMQMALSDETGSRDRFRDQNGIDTSLETILRPKCHTTYSDETSLKTIFKTKTVSIPVTKPVSTPKCHTLVDWKILPRNTQFWLIPSLCQLLYMMTHCIPCNDETLKIDNQTCRKNMITQTEPNQIYFVAFQ